MTTRPAKKQQEGSMNVIPVGIYCLLCVGFDTNKVANLSSIYNKASINAFYLMNPSNPQPDNDTFSFAGDNFVLIRLRRRR